MTDPSPDTRWLLGGDLPCLACQYNLRGLVGPVVACPECGHHNDLRNPASWRDVELPLGVKQREHWPASSVMASLAVPPAFAMGIGSLLNDGIRLGLVTVVFGLIVMYFWGRSCMKWVRSTEQVGWACAVLVVLHLSSWILIAGWWLPVFLELPWWIVPPIIAAGVIVFGYCKHTISRAETRKRFRQDWRDWRVPLVDATRASGHHH